MGSDTSATQARRCPTALASPCLAPPLRTALRCSAQRDQRRPSTSAQREQAHRGRRAAGKAGLPYPYIHASTHLSFHSSIHPFIHLLLLERPDWILLSRLCTRTAAEQSLAAAGVSGWSSSGAGRGHTGPEAVKGEKGKGI